MRKGTDITRPFNKFLDSIANAFYSIKDFKFTRPKAKSPKAKKWDSNSSNSQSQKESKGTSSGKASASPEDQAELDKILDKIKKSGYTALSAEEKKRLFDVSKRIK